VLGRGDEGGAATAAAADRQLHPCSCVPPSPQTGPVAPLLLRRAAAADRGRRGQRLGEGALELTHARAMLRASAPERAPQLGHGASASQACPKGHLSSPMEPRGPRPGSASSSSMEPRERNRGEMERKIEILMCRPREMREGEGCIGRKRNGDAQQQDGRARRSGAGRFRGGRATATRGRATAAVERGRAWEMGGRTDR